MSNWVKRVRLVHRVYSVIEYGVFFAGAAVVVFLMLFVTAHVVGRYVFNWPIPGHLELVELLLPALLFAGMAWVEKIGIHIRVDLLPPRLKGKTHHATECLFHLLSLVPMVMITVFSTKYSLTLLKLNSVSPDYHIPVFPFTIWVGIGCGLISVRLIIKLIQNIAAFWGKGQE